MKTATTPSEDEARARANLRVLDRYYTHQSPAEDLVLLAVAKSLTVAAETPLVELKVTCSTTWDYGLALELLRGAAGKKCGGTWDHEHGALELPNGSCVSLRFEAAEPPRVPGEIS